MHPGNWTALVVVALLLSVVVAARIRAQRQRRAAELQHRPAPGGQPRHDEATVILVGKVAADGARSSSG